MQGKEERDGDRALVRAFMAWLRDQDLAVCVRVDEPEGTRVLWQPLSCGSAQLVADFEAALEREEAQEQAQEEQEESRATEEQEQEQDTDVEAPRLLQTMDAKEWAQAFMRIIVDGNVPIDEGLMIGWFANAIMTGWDFSARGQQEERKRG